MRSPNFRRAPAILGDEDGKEVFVPSEVQIALDVSASSSPSTFLSSWLQNCDEWLSPSSAREFRRYYSSYVKSFDRRLRYYYDRQMDELLQAVAARQKPRVLEVGCGLGTETLYLALQGADVLAIDLSRRRLDVALERKALLEKALNRELHCEFLLDSVLDAAFSHTFDAIWMEQAFHHVEPRQRFVRRLIELLSPGGVLVISEANGLNPLVQAKYFRQRGFKTRGTFVDELGRKHEYGRERILTAQGLSKLLAKEGFRSIGFSHFRVFPNSALFRTFDGIERRFPSWLWPVFTHYNLVAHKE